MAKHSYEVIVGNIGTVYSGGSKAEAEKKFDGYVEGSMTGARRSGDEDVTMMCDGEICREHVGALSLLQGLREDGASTRDIVATMRGDTHWPEAVRNRVIELAKGV